MKRKAIAVLVGVLVWTSIAAAAPSANERAARADAIALLAKLRLPEGAVLSATEPAGGGSSLQPSPALNATTARADSHAWWQVPGSAAAVIAFITGHPPAGSKLDGTGSFSRGGKLISQSVDFVWPSVRGVLGERELAVTVAASSDGYTGLLAQAQSDWIVRRPPGERIPAGVDQIEISTAALGGPATRALTVTSRSRVHRIVALIDTMPIVGPAVFNCPALLLQGAQRLTLVFRSTDGVALAHATYIAYPGLASSSGPCNPLQFWIGRRRQEPLVGGRFLGRLDRIVGVSLYQRPRQRTPRT